MIVTQHELARLLRVTARTIRSWHAEGLPRRADGRYDVRAALPWYVKRREDDLLRQEQVRLTREQADRVALQNADRRSQLGERLVWERELVPLFRRICRLIGTLPALAPRLTGNLNQRQAVLDDAVRSILSRLSMPPGGARWPRQSK